MRKIFFCLSFLIFCVSQPAKPQEAWNPQADSAAVVTSGRARFTVLTPQLIRIQYSTTNDFEDRATFAVVNRRLPVPHFTCSEEDGYLTIETDSLLLRYRVGGTISRAAVNSSVLRITFRMGRKEVLWYPGKDNALNLLGTNRTLDGAIGDTHRPMLDYGLLSREGWAVLDESPAAEREDGSRSFAFDHPVDGIPWVATPVDAKAVDWYFFGYGHQYKAALQDYVRIAGRQPIPPRFMFGYWYSKYQAYTSSQFQQIVRDMEANAVPHDVIMFDVDWHQYGWTGWTWNKSLIPSPTTLLNWMHARRMKVGLNLHPADGVGSEDDNFAQIRQDMGLPSTATNVPWQLEDSTFYRTMFRNLIRKREEQGVDFWWIDWQQDKTSSFVPGLGNTFWCNHVFFNDMRVNRPDRRPIILHRWGGNGSHRYPIGFSGDTFATYATMRYEAYFTATAANICMGYWSHDGGGYLQPNESPTDEELVLRWLQYCVFSPIFRTHGSSQSGCERRVWRFSNFGLQRQAMQLRYQLIPYIYTCAREAYDTGVSICRPLYYEWPEENLAYSVEDQYLFGPDILVAPVFSESDCAGNTAQRTTWLPDGLWYDVCRGQMLEGGTRHTDLYALNEIPYFIRSGSILPCNPQVSSLQESTDTLCLMVVPGTEGEGRLYEDEGDTQGYQQGKFTFTHFQQQRGNGRVELIIQPRQGTYDGMPETRVWTADFVAQDRPLRVTVNGEETTDWAYNEVERRLHLTIGRQPCDQPTRVVLESETSIAENNSLQPQLAYVPDAQMLCVKTKTTARNIKLMVTDLSGRRVMEAVWRGRTQAECSVASLPTGSYVCHVNADGQTVTRKFLKY